MMDMDIETRKNSTLRQTQKEIIAQLRNPKKRLPSAPLQLTDGQVARQRELLAKVKAKRSGKVGENWGK